jgi:hypothetical protein
MDIIGFIALFLAGMTFTLASVICFIFYKSYKNTLSFNSYTPRRLIQVQDIQDQASHAVFFNSNFVNLDKYYSLSNKNYELIPQMSAVISFLKSMPGGLALFNQTNLSSFLFREKYYNLFSLLFFLSREKTLTNLLESGTEFFAAINDTEIDYYTEPTDQGLIKFSVSMNFDERFCEAWKQFNSSFKKELGRIPAVFAWPWFFAYLMQTRSPFTYTTTYIARNERSELIYNLSFHESFSSDYSHDLQKDFPLLENGAYIKCIN